MIGGLIALPFLVRTYPIGTGFNRSVGLRYAEEDASSQVSLDEYASRLMIDAARLGVKIVLPVDFVAAPRGGGPDVARVTIGPAVPNGLEIVDIGPKTRDLFAREIRESKSVLWDGVLGRCDLPEFSEGTASVMKELRVVFEAGNREWGRVVIGGEFTAEAAVRANLLNDLPPAVPGGALRHIMMGYVPPGLAMLTDAAAQMPTASRETLMKLLRQLPPFCGCSDVDLQPVVDIAVGPRTHSAGDTLQFDGSYVSTIFIVAEGALVAFPFCLRGKSLAKRFIGQGECAGLWEALAGCCSRVHVEAALGGTVTFQLPREELHEIILRSPLLASKLLSGASSGVHFEMSVVRAAEADEMHRTAVGAYYTRKLVPFFSSIALPLGGIVADAVCTIALHPLTLQYLPYIEEPGTCIAARAASGLPLRTIRSVLRDVSYHYFMPIAMQALPGRSFNLLRPISAAILSAVVTEPLALAARGVAFDRMPADVLLDNCLTAAASSIAPIAAHWLFLVSRSWMEVKTARKTATKSSNGASPLLPVPSVVFLAALSRAFVALAVFPIISRRCPPQCRTSHHLMVFILKQICALLVELMVHRLMNKRRPRHHP